MGSVSFDVVTGNDSVVAVVPSRGVAVVAVFSDSSAVADCC